MRASDVKPRPRSARASSRTAGACSRASPGEMMVTIQLRKVVVGTEVNIVQEGVPAVIPPEACYLGWQKSLELLAKLVEPEIPG